MVRQRSRTGPGRSNGRGSNDSELGQTRVNCLVLMSLSLGRLASPFNRARRRTQPSPLTPSSRSRLLAMAVMFFLATPVGGRILKTRPSASSTWTPWSAIVVGSGLEFQTDHNQSEYEFPLLL